MYRLLLIVACLLISFRLHAAHQNPADASYHLGIFPYMEPRQTVELFGPVAALMTKELGLPVYLESTTTFVEFSRKIKSNIYDIALIQPFDYPKVVEQQGYIPLAKIDASLVTQLMVREDSKYQQLSDMRGTTIGLPPEQSANARMIIRALRDNKIAVGKDVKIKYFKSHDSCLQQVLIGDVSACGTSHSPVVVFEERMKVKFRSVYNSEAIPRTLFVVHPRVSAVNRDKLKSMILNWGKTAESRELLNKLGFNGFMPIIKGEYDVIHKYLKDEKKAAEELSYSKDLFLGVFPFLGTRQLIVNFSPIIPAFKHVAKLPVYLRTSVNFEAFSSALDDAQFDIAIIQPFDFERAEKSGYLPVAAMSEMLEGNFFVPDNSEIQKISDLKGKVIAMPPYNSVQARLGREALHSEGFNLKRDVTIDYRKTHESCLQQTHLGEAAACITSPLTFKMLPPEMGMGLRKIGKTLKVPGVLFVVHKRVPRIIREHIREEIISWKDTEKGREILKSMGFGEFSDVDLKIYRQIPKI